MKFFRKIAGLSPAVKASISFFISTLIAKGINFITTPIFTRLLSEEVFGQVSVYYTWMQLFGIVAMFCLSYAVFNVGLLDYPEKRDEFSFSILILSNIITLCFAAILFCLYPLIKNFLNLSIVSLILMIVFFLMQPAYLFWMARQRFEYKYKWPFLWTIVTIGLSLAVPIVLIVTAKDPSNNFYYRVFGSEISLIVFYIGFYIFIGVKAKFKINKSYWKSVFLFNLPIIPHYLSAYLLNSSDKLMIAYIVGEEATAFYTVAYAIASIAIIIWNSVDASFMPYTFQKLKEENYDAIRKISIPILLIFALGCCIIMFLGPEMVYLMGSSGYKEAAYVIPPVVGGVFFQIQYFLYSNVLYYYKKQKFVLFGSVTAAVLNIILNYFCIKQFGYIAAAYTTLGCYFVQAVIDYVAMRTATKNKIYNLPFILIVSSIVTAISLTTVFLYKYSIPRYIILGVLLLVLAIFSKKIIKIFMQIKKEGKNG